MNKKNPYQNFKTYILRKPILPFDFYKKLTSKSQVTDHQYLECFENPLIAEAIYLASPALYNSLKQWRNQELLDSKKVDKLKTSFLKYLTRMSTRSTPFGLFAGCSLGSFTNKNRIHMREPIFNKRHTRLDMTYLVALSHALVKNPEIRKQIMFFPNTTIYEIGNKLRYVEYFYRGGKRFHHIMAVDNMDYTKQILCSAKNGKTIKELTLLLVNEDIEFKEAENFINEMIDSQILVSELEPSVSGPEFLEQIIETLGKMSGIEPTLQILMNIREKISSLDTSLGQPIERYSEIINLLKDLNIDFDKKFLFQSELFLKPFKNTLDEKIVQSIKKGLVFLNRITLKPQNSNIEKFREAFRHRYENEEIALSKALDVELGIGYKQGLNKGTISPLIDDIVFLEDESGQTKIWTSVNRIFHRLIVDALFEKKYKIEIKDKDFDFQDEDWSDLPETISAMIQVLNINGTNKIKFGGFAGSSGANLMGRFCHGNNEIKEFVNHIISKENEATSKQVLAEIVHLPESRVGNILSRPVLREYEIPYLGKSILRKNKQIPLNDLFISIKQEKVILKSKRLNKEILPRNTTAHNYSAAQLPIYQFLCDIQTKSERRGIGLDFGPISEEYTFIPRIEYKDLIFHEATWNFDFAKVANLYGIKKGDVLLNKVKSLQSKWQIPDLILLADGDNRLLINLKNIDSIIMLLETVKNRDKFTFKEFLFNDMELGKTNPNIVDFPNEIIVSFYKNDENQR